MAVTSATEWPFMIDSARLRTSSIWCLFSPNVRYRNWWSPNCDQVALAEEAAPVQAHGQVERAGAADDRVVDVEERAGAGTVRTGPRVPQHGSGGVGVPGRLTHLVTVTTARGGAGATGPVGESLVA